MMRQFEKAFKTIERTQESIRNLRGISLREIASVGKAKVQHYFREATGDTLSLQDA